MKKSNRLPKGSWELNGSLFESNYHVLVSTVCHLLDPFAIRRGVPYTKDVLTEAVKYLKATNPGIPFTIDKIKVYANATATNDAFINKDFLELRVSNYANQLAKLRKYLLELK